MAPAPQRDNAKCTIVILLPAKPCDLYVEGTLLKAGVTDKVEMVTPDLAPGKYKYKLVVVDSSDSSKTEERIVTGVVAGGNITVDFRGHEVASR